MTKSPHCRRSWRPPVLRGPALRRAIDRQHIFALPVWRLADSAIPLRWARGVASGGGSPHPRRRQGLGSMKYRLRIASAALLAVAAAPAWALQLGQIQVKSALNQPLVAAIPLHPKTLSELDGLTVALASPEDFTRAGLQRTPTDQTLRFHVVSDNNGQKLILVTSTQPVSDPYLDFLLQVNTRQGKQVREFVVLLNPVIEAPAPAVQTAPVAEAPVATPRQPVATPPTELPPPQVTPQAAQQPLTPAPQPKPHPKADRRTQPASRPQARPQPQAKKAQPTQVQSRPQPQPQPKPKPAVPPKPKAAPKPKA